MEGQVMNSSMKVVMVTVCTISILSASADYFKLHLDSCVLKISTRYQHISLNTPSSIKFRYSEVEKETTKEDKAKNLLLTHNIAIDASRDKNKNKNIEKLSKIYDLIDSTIINGVQIYRFKDQPYAGIKKPNRDQQRHIKMINTNNIFYVYGEGFHIVAQETDKYIYDIYKMIEDCGKQSP